LPVVLYSPDYQKMFADFNPAYSPWINFPDGLIHKGYVGICFDEGTISDAARRQYFAALNPDARHIEIALQWRAYGMATPPLKLHLEIVGPKPRRGWAFTGLRLPPFLNPLETNLVGGLRGKFISGTLWPRERAGKT
jgi:hypothetical protein